MSHKVYPTTATPFSVAANSSASISFSELASSGAPPEMYIRLTILSSSATPVVSLAATAAGSMTAGAAVALILSSGGTTVTIYDAAEMYVGTATFANDPNGFGGVFLVRVLLVTKGSGWTLTIGNSENVARQYTFVVADSDADSQQPWIDMATSLAFDMLVTDPASQKLLVNNYGTGTMSITPTLSGPNASGFTVTVPPAVINPNSATALTIAANAVTMPQRLVATLDVGSNDGDALKSPGHNMEVALTASIGMLEVGFMLDASGSMGLSGPGNPPTAAAPSRWSFLVSAASASLDLLTNFASGKGNFAVGVYPDVITKSFGVPNANDFQATTAISAASIAAAKTAVQNAAYGPGGSTPMGSGIARAIGPGTAAPWGYFSDNAMTNALNNRWLVLMTDGNDNFDDASTPPSAFFADPPAAAPAQGFLPKNIQVMAIGYGNLAASGVVSPVNTMLLTNIVNGAANPNAANFHFAQADSGPGIVASFIKGMLDGVLTAGSFSDPAGVLTAASPTVTRQVIIGPYDNKVAFFVAWGTDDAERLNIQVMTPLGEALTATTDTGCTVDVGNRYRMITADKAFLDNAKAAKPRYGTWTLTITLSATYYADTRGSPSEAYNYQIITDSRLKLRCTLDKTPYSAGDAITLTGRLTLDGQAITGASVTVAQTTPGVGALNWLAAAPLSATDYATAAATAQEANPDTDSLGIKQFALQNKGTVFNPVVSSASAIMTDADVIGAYSVTSSNTAVPGAYDFLVTAVGTLADGTLFRREQSVTIEVIVRADPAATILQVQYLPGAGGANQAVYTVWPQDRFGNVVLIDPEFDPSLLFSTTAGSFTGPIVDNHDGSYSRTLSYPAGTAPSVGVTVGGLPVVPVTPVEPVNDLHFVDRVYSFKAGVEAIPGANQHANPTACLGNFTTRATPGFVSTGAGGQLIVGFSGHYAVDDHHGHGITVFIQPDQPLRPYSVEVSHGDEQTHWFEVGRSPGVTQSFSLHGYGHLPTARAVRIRDRSGRIFNADGTPSASPGVSVLAVGARRIERGDGDLDDLLFGWLRKLGHEIFG